MIIFSKWDETEFIWSKNYFCFQINDSLARHLVLVVLSNPKPETARLEILQLQFDEFFSLPQSHSHNDLTRVGIINEIFPCPACVPQPVVCGPAHCDKWEDGGLLLTAITPNIQIPQ